MLTPSPSLWSQGPAACTLRMASSQHADPEAVLGHNAQPQVDGLAGKASSAVSLDMRAIAAADDYDIQITPLGDNCPSPAELSPGKYGQAVSRLGVKCSACAERADFVEAAQKWLSRLSIRSLKNILAVRGVGCKACRTRDQLQMAALHAATLALKNVTLPLFDASHAHAKELRVPTKVGADMPRLFPRGVIFLRVFDERHRLLVHRCLASNQRFVLKQGPKHGIVAKILEHGDKDGSMWVRIRGEQRVHLVKTAVEANTHGLEYCKGYLFVDNPIYKKDASLLDHMQKRLRRLFFLLDTDDHADRRAGTIGNPPEEAHGPEALSHWISQAVCTANMHRAGADPDLASFLLKTQNTTRRLDVLDNALTHKLEESHKK